MRRAFMVALALSLGSGPIYAQNAMGVPAMGATSPLGIVGAGSSGASAPSITIGIPLGATELDPGGLSPAISPDCGTSAASASVNSSGVSSAFDGGGVAGSAGVSSTCTVGAQAVSPTGSGSSPDALTGSAYAPAGSTIPFGATEINAPGTSPLITVSPPNSLQCVGSTVVGQSAGAAC